MMPFIEHDLKTLLETMPHPFLQSEVKTLMMQLLSAVAHCHSNWIVSRVPRLRSQLERLVDSLLHNTGVTVASGPQDFQLVVDKSRADQGGRFRARQEVRRPVGRDDAVGGDALVPVSPSYPVVYTAPP